MQDYMTTYISNHALQASAPDKQQSEVSLEERQGLVGEVREMGEEEVARFLEKLNQLCPRALLRLSDDKLQIKVDSIDKSTFSQIYEAPTKKAKLQ